MGPLGSNKELAEAAECMAQRGLTQEGAPALIRLITQVATRFGIPVTEKVMAQSVPAIGAAGAPSSTCCSSIISRMSRVAISSSEAWSACTEPRP